MWKFNFDREKATSIIAWMQSYKVQYYHYHAFLYFIDREHLLLHGRPVVGGNYFAGCNFILNIELVNLLIDLWFPNIKAEFDEDQLSESDFDVMKSNIEYLCWDKSQFEEKFKSLELLNKNLHNIIPYEDFFLGEKGYENMIDIINDDQEAIRCLDFIGEDK